MLLRSGYFVLFIFCSLYIRGSLIIQLLKQKGLPDNIVGQPLNDFESLIQKLHLLKVLLS